MKIIVTGATGFLGKHLVRHLISKGQRVLSVGRNQKELDGLLNLGSEIANLDLSNEQQVQDFASKQISEGDVVVHAAALSSPWGSYQEFLKANVLATQNVIKMCLSRKAERLIYISTPSLYITEEDRLNIRESDALPNQFINHYASTKKIAEDLVTVASTQGLRTIMLRPQAILGPEDQTILPRILRLAKKGIMISIGNHRPQLDITFVENVVHAIELSIQTKEANCFGQKFNISNGTPVIFHDFLDQIYGQLGIAYQQVRIQPRMADLLVGFAEGVWKIIPLRGEPPLTQYNVNLLKYHRTLNIEKAQKLLGYQVVLGHDQGTKQLVDWIRTSGILS